MARSLLIALMALAAVATPASADGLASPPEPLPDYSPVTVDQDEHGITVALWIPNPLGLACTVASCSTTALRAESATWSQCNPVEVRVTNSWPGYYVVVDEDNCIREIVDYALNKIPPSDERLPDEWLFDSSFGLLS